VVVAVPETNLPDIPLGSVPGTLKLKVTDKSSLTSTFEGGCMRVAGEQATYVGTTKTSGTLVLNGTLAIDMPGLSKSIELGDIEVPIPDTDTPMDFGAQPTKGVSDGQKGRACPATPGSGTPGSGTPGSGTPGDAGSTPSREDGGTTGGTSTVTVTIDGAPATMTGCGVDEVTDNNESYPMLNCKGSLQGAGFQLHVVATAPGQGCADASTGVAYVPVDGSTPFSTRIEAACGLSVTAWSASRRSGSFGGVLYASDDSNKTHNVTMTFDVKP
jgi:hypothetical protein